MHCETDNKDVFATLLQCDFRTLEVFKPKYIDFEETNTNIKQWSTEPLKEILKMKVI